MIIKDFVEEFRNKKIMNTKINPDAVSQYLNGVLEIKTYIPYLTKRQIAEMVVENNIEETDGVKKYDNISAYIGFIMAMLTAHTNLECGDNPFEDYDALAESGLLPLIIEEFRASYNECDIILKMAVDSALEDNNVNVLVGQFLDRMSIAIDGIAGTLKDKIENIDIKDLFGADIKTEDLARLIGFLDKIK